MRRIGILAMGSVIAMMVWGVAPANAAEIVNDGPAARHSMSLANDERDNRGKRAFRWSDELAAVARDHSEDMARNGELEHDSALPNKVDGWSALAENVGVAGSADSIHESFMDSDTHRGNILGSFVEIGVGVAVDGSGQRWLTQIFRTPKAASPSGSGSRAEATRTSSPRPPKASTKSIVARQAPLKRATTMRTAGTVVRAPKPVIERSRTVSMLQRITGEDE